MVPGLPVKQRRDTVSIGMSILELLPQARAAAGQAALQLRGIPEGAASWRFLCVRRISRRDLECSRVRSPELRRRTCGGIASAALSPHSFVATLVRRRSRRSESRALQLRLRWRRPLAAAHEIATLSITLMATIRPTERRPIHLLPVALALQRPRLRRRQLRLQRRQLRRRSSPTCTRRGPTTGRLRARASRPPRASRWLPPPPRAGQRRCRPRARRAPAGSRRAAAPPRRSGRRPPAAPAAAPTARCAPTPSPSAASSPTRSPRTACTAD